MTFTSLREHAFLKQHVHALVEAAASVGGPPIQNVATWAGNIVQAMPAADGAVVAVALDAEVQIVDEDGARWRPVESLFEGPGISAVDPTRQLITAIRFSPSGSGRSSSASEARPRWGTAWRRVGRRPALALPILNCAVAVCLEERLTDRSKLSREGPGIRRVAIALGPVGPRPERMREAESFLTGRLPTEETIARAAELATCEARPRSSTFRASREYRLEIIPVLVTEALNAALARAELCCTLNVAR